MQTLHVVFHASYSGARRTADCVRLQQLGKKLSNCERLLCGHWRDYKIQALL